MEFLGTDLRFGGAAGPSAFKPRVNSQASAASITPDIAAYDGYVLTALAADLTVNAPTGTPYDGQHLTIIITDNGNARNITWNAAFERSAGFNLPASTLAGAMLVVELIYNAAQSKWICVNLSYANRWQQIGSSASTASGSQWDFTSIPSTFRDLRLVFEAVSASTTAVLRIQVSTDNGSNWSATSTIYPSSGATTILYGVLYILDYSRSDIALMIQGIGVGAGTLVIGDNAGTSRSVYLAGNPINAIRISYSAGSGDGGSLSLWGR